MQGKKGDYVKVYRVILNPDERAPQVPDDTKKVPLEMWVKGFLKDESAKIGDEVKIETITGRDEYGKLVAINPTYSHSFGDFVPELLQIGQDLRGILFGGEA